MLSNRLIRQAARQLLASGGTTTNQRLGGRLLTHTRTLMKPVGTEKGDEPKLSTLLIERPAEFIVNVQLNRPKQRNALNSTLWDELKLCFDYLATDPECRVVIVTGNGPSFCAGLDFQAMGQAVMNDELDTSRKAFHIGRMIKRFQDDFTAIENCPKPVISAIHHACVGGAASLITACDMRYATKDAFFSVKEVDIGLAADVGALQRLPKIIGNEGLVRELIYTCRQFDANEAMDMGLIARVYDNQSEMMTEVMKVATEIAKKSPVAVQGSKVGLNYARDHTVQDGLDFIVG